MAQPHLEERVLFNDQAPDELVTVSISETPSGDIVFTQRNSGELTSAIFGQPSYVQTLFIPASGRNKFLRMFEVHSIDELINYIEHSYASVALFNDIADVCELHGIACEISYPDDMPQSADEDK